MRTSWKWMVIVFVVISAAGAIYMFATGTPTRDPAIASGVTLTIEDGTVFCPSGGSPRLWLWDNTGGAMWDGASPLNVPIASNAMRLDESVVNGTVWCSTGAGTFEGYVSPSIADSSVGSEAASVGARVHINGEERPAFICWDIAAPHANPMFHRIQFRADATGDAPGCYPGTL